MREILFRGKRIYGGDWIEGYYAYDELYDAHTISFNTPTGGDGYIEPPVELVSKHVDPATVGQYTGLTDKNGKKIFGGDVLFDSVFEYQGIVVWEETEGAFAVEFENISESLGEWHATEVVGNIHDNPEFLGVE